MTGWVRVSPADSSPKAELHVHQSARPPRIVAELAARHPETPVPKDPDALRDFFAFRDFDHFVQVYLAVVDLIRTDEDVHHLTYEVAREMAALQIRYAELTVTPYTSMLAGIPPPAFCAAIEDARERAERELGIVLRWCFDIPGEFGVPAAEETVRSPPRRATAGLVASGSAGRRWGAARAVPAGLRPGPRGRAALVPHAGETTGPQTMWDAIRLLGAERIGHGISAAQDPQLMAHLVEHGIALEVCPTSNVRHAGRRVARRAPAAPAARRRGAR